MIYHVPVMLKQCMEALNIKPDGTYVDVTYGGGGHSRAILSLLGPQGRLMAMDQDEDALKNHTEDGRLQLVKGNFRFLKNFLKYYDWMPVDGILADLGVSSHHLDEPERGFSFRWDAALDMRMNVNAALTAADVVNEYEEQKIAEIFSKYGELSGARKLANELVKERAKHPVCTTGQLAKIVEKVCQRGREKKELAKAFQALRMEVNHELDALEQMLKAAEQALRPGGRLVVMTYHSLEDRMVKNFIKTGNVEGKLEKDFFGNVCAPMLDVNRGATMADEEELSRNPRSRSAKLRVGEKKQEKGGKKA